MGHRAFLGLSALLFVGSVAAVVKWCTSMSTMSAMPMPGGSAMSMSAHTSTPASMYAPTSMLSPRIPEAAWPGAAASFVGMWVVMMLAMMLPSLVPELLRYREAVGRRGEVPLGRLTALAGAGYFAVWAVAGLAVFLVSAVLGVAATRQPALERAAPIAAAVFIIIAGALQLTAWKARHLACCRAVPGKGGRESRASLGTAWRHGVRHGLHCVSGCAGLTMILLALGVMDLRAMTAVAAAITAERLAPAGERVARIIGVAAIVAGFVLFALAAGRGQL